MANFRKMTLVPSSFIEDLQRRNNVFSDPDLERTLALDKSMREVMNSKTDDFNWKTKNYVEILKSYSKFKNRLENESDSPIQPQPALTVNTPSPTADPPMEQEVTSIPVEPEELHTNEHLPQETPPLTARDGKASGVNREFLPHYARRAGKKIVEHLTKNGVKVGEDGQVLINGVGRVGIDFEKAVADIASKRRNKVPQQSLRLIKLAKIPPSLIANHELWYLSEDKNGGDDWLSL